MQSLSSILAIQNLQAHFWKQFYIQELERRMEEREKQVREKDQKALNAAIK